MTDVVDDESHDKANVSRIDLKSGFMKQIIRNQQNRDDYDKEMKQKEPMKYNAKGSKAKNNTKKPEQAIYHPPMNKGNKAPANMNGHPKDMFTLQYEDPYGEISEWLVRKGDNPHKLAERFGRQCRLMAPLIQALGSLIEEEMDKRGLQT